MKVLVTGASGYVGSRIYTELSQSHITHGTYHKTKLFDELEKVDLTNKEETLAFIESNNPDIIVNAAGNGSAKICYSDPKLARKINVDSVANIVSGAEVVGAKLIHISTTATINPSEPYGQTKKLSEDEVKKLKNALILRPSLIVGQSPNTINDRSHNRLLKNIIDKTPPIYDNTWTFQPTYLGHLSGLVKECINKDIFGEIISVTVDERKTRFGIAKDILEHFDIFAIEADTKDLGKEIFTNQEKLLELGLTTYNYKKLLISTVSEIKEFLKNSN
jgi:dTDP-4-dehydrorhamnose reductase